MLVRLFVRGVCPALAHLPAIDWWNRASQSHLLHQAHSQPVMQTLIRPPRALAATSDMTQTLYPANLTCRGSMQRINRQVALLLGLLRLAGHLSAEVGVLVTGSQPLQAPDGLRAALQDTPREERATR